jgi:hypothetical protein
MKLSIDLRRIPAALEAVGAEHVSTKQTKHYKVTFAYGVSEGSSCSLAALRSGAFVFTTPGSAVSEVFGCTSYSRILLKLST